MSDKAALALKAVEKIDRLIALTYKKIDLLTEMRDVMLIAGTVGVDPKLILSKGFKRPTRDEHRRWPEEAKLRLPWGMTWHGPSACEYRGHDVVNRVKLRDGTEIILDEPLFLSNAAKTVPIRKPVTKRPGRSG